MVSSQIMVPQDGHRVEEGLPAHSAKPQEDPTQPNRPPRTEGNLELTRKLGIGRLPFFAVLFLYIVPKFITRNLVPTTSMQALQMGQDEVLLL
jgi:hypothetical protein